MLRDHGIAAIIYGGAFVDDDFRDRRVADKWFEAKYQKKLAAKDFEATAKYRYDEKFNTGGTFGVNYAFIGGSIIAFNYRSINMEESERVAIHEKLILNHYLKQFNEETIQTKQQRTCGEPCFAVCKKMKVEYKMDYEQYQTMGPLAGIFDQRTAEKLTHHADMLGFDAISAGEVVSWLMDCIHDSLLKPYEAGAKDMTKFDHNNFDAASDSSKNADIGVDILNAMIERRGSIDLCLGARKLAKRLSRENGKDVLDRFVYTAYARNGWMVPNQYWTPGALSLMAIMGKYYMHYGKEFIQPRKLGRINASRFKKKLILDELGVCRFHRGWAEEMLSEITGALFGKKDEFIERIAFISARINSRNSSVFWKPGRNIDFIYQFSKRESDVSKTSDPELDKWIRLFENDRMEAALSYWYEMYKGITESLRELG
jgi:glyceraldehyde-3-phosphate dehydrogenase (ferredoxin)